MLSNWDKEWKEWMQESMEGFNLISEFNNRLWKLEEKIRELTNKGMRYGRAIKRVVPDLGSDYVKSLASAWDGTSFNVIISDTRSDFIRAFNACNSCMKGKGAQLWQVYNRLNGAILVYRVNDKTSARMLINKVFSLHYTPETETVGWKTRINIAPNAYGENWHILKALVGALGIYSQDWMGEFDEEEIRKAIPKTKIQVVRYRTYQTIKFSYFDHANKEVKHVMENNEIAIRYTIREPKYTWIDNHGGFGYTDDDY